MQTRSIQIIKMKKISSKIQLIALSLLFGLILSSCLENVYEEKEREEQAMIDGYVNANGFTEDEKLENGIYLKFIHDNTNDTTKPVTGNTVIVEYTGKYTDGSVFETTDASIGESEFPDRYFVYGPIRLKMGNLMYGFDTTLRHLTPGDEVSMIIPSKFMWYDYIPVVYDLKLLAIIQNDSTYEADMFNDFIEHYGFSDTNTFGANSNGELLYWKVTTKDDSSSSHPDSLNRHPITVATNDSVWIEITARYAELDTFSVPGEINLGRIFYPLVNYPKEIVYKYGNSTTFPITRAVDSAVKAMALSDEIEVCGPASWAYGDYGFSDQFHNIIAVPPRTPVHYQIKLLNKK